MMKIKEWFSHSLEIVDDKSRKLLLLSTLLGFVWFGVELSFVYILQGFLLSLQILSPEQLKVPSWFPVGIYQSTILLISFGIVRSAVNYFKNYFSVVAQHAFIRRCRDELIDLGLDSKLFLSSSEYLTLFSDRVNQSGVFVQYVSLGLVTFCSVCLFFIFGVFFAPKEMVFSLSLTIILMLPIKKMIYQVEKTGSSLITEWNQVNEEVLNSKRNYFFLAVYDLINFKKAEIKNHLSEYEGHYNTYASVSSFFSSIPLFVGVSVLSLCAFLSIQYFHTPGVKILSFFYIFLRMVQGLSELNTTAACLKLTYPSFRETRDVLIKLKSADESAASEGQKSKEKFKTKDLSIKFNSVGFAYPGGKFLYENLNLVTDHGDVVIIKGPSGAGKSTLLKLLLGLEQPSKGEILINGLSVNTLDPKWRLHLGYVGPDPFLIKGTVQDNLDFGNSGITKFSEKDYWNALDLAGLASEFKKSNIDLNTVMSELSFLSTGQKQRLAIARAFLRKPSILIFDEATANLDSETERQIVDNLASFSSGITTIIVTHKNSFDKVGTKFITIGN